MDANYWWHRLFKSVYYYKGKRAEVSHWSVKIQLHGIRRTLPLVSRHKREAAREACELYREIVTTGWEVVSAGQRNGTFAAQRSSETPLPREAAKLEVDYWKQRLIHREYAMATRPDTAAELAVRVTHGATSYYFPLETADRAAASERALRIYKTVVQKGWAAANQQFSRELTLGFHWLDRPLAWTYTTIHTQPVAFEPKSAGTEPPPGSCRVAIVEADAGTRNALASCLGRMDRFYSAGTFSGAHEFFRDLKSDRVDLVLMDENLPGTTGTACVEELKAAAPRISVLLYSVYEDSEELFRTTPGGAGTYLLQRTGPAEFLKPIHEVVWHEPLSNQKMITAVWQHFRESLTSPPMRDTARQLSHLTHREHEVLALLTKGHPDKDLADQLGISIHTVHEHVRNIFEKLGVHNRTEAVVKFLQK